jgi:putative transcriptional regulator
MNNRNITVRTRKKNGEWAIPDANGREHKLDNQTDWSALDAMSGTQRLEAAESDPDALPLTPEDFKRLRRVARVKSLRRSLALTQEQFAARFHIPIGTLRDWEQGRSEPDQTARAYLTVIAHEPESVRKALSVSA